MRGGGVGGWGVGGEGGSDPFSPSTQGASKRISTWILVEIAVIPLQGIKFPQKNRRTLSAKPTA